MEWETLSTPVTKLTTDANCLKVETGLTEEALPEFGSPVIINKTLCNDGSTFCREKVFICHIIGLSNDGGVEREEFVHTHIMAWISG